MASESYWNGWLANTLPVLISSILIDPFQQSAQLNYGPNCPLESLWAQKQIQIKYTIQKPYVFSSIYVF